MKNFYYKLLLLLILPLIQIKLVAQDFIIDTKSEEIQINKDTSYTKHISVILEMNESVTAFPIFYDSELEEITDLKVFIKKGKRFKLDKNPIISDDDVKIDYLTSKKVKSIVIPPQVQVKIDYKVNCPELMYFSSLPFFTYNDADTLSYNLTIPESFHFAYNILYRDSLHYLSIDSLKDLKVKKWNIKVVPIKIKPDPLMYFGIYKDIKEPLMRTIVVPATYIDKEKEYMNDWYFNKVKTSRGLSLSTQKKIDELTDNVSDPMKILEILYDYVQTNFKYVAIEVGMGAFIPSHANEVFTNKHGDCKDLSNFLSEALNYKGIKSDVALAATYNHITDCDFPSLGSANHEVCVAYINDQLIVLDPTDPIHLPNTPVQSLQNRSILIINPEGGEFYKVNCLKPEENEINYDIELNVDSKQALIAGRFKVNYNGITSNFLRREIDDLSENEINSIGEKLYESIFGNQFVSSLRIIDNKYTVDVDGDLSVQSKSFNDKENLFLFIDFLPRIIESENKESVVLGTHLGSVMDKKVKLKLKLDIPFKPFDDIEHSFSKDGIFFNLKITNPSDYIIECNYEFIQNYFIVENSNIDIINEALESYKKIINEPIILKTK
ncbi:transglutaminase-like domain-containing protein [Chondrinema litorale]|uniref:transglutaminase-like domain-containing protein n=1 Tax=Chondrinema litorale TaxID=2994555 RepID=UPI002543A051|nr:transglutaminase-like domain-containing protein [Chondrinema litorale]UZR97148.1 transglutaminase-like domain-containing protein [Chondrinema litorale]